MTLTYTNLTEATPPIHGQFHPTDAACACRGEGWTPGPERDVPCPFHAVRELRGSSDLARELEDMERTHEDELLKLEDEVADLQDKLHEARVLAKKLATGCAT